MIKKILIIMLLLLGYKAFADGHALNSKPVINLSVAKLMADACEADQRKRGYNPVNIAINNPPNGNITFEVKLSRRSKKVYPNNFKSAAKLKDNIVPIPSSHVNTPSLILASALLIENFSIIYVIAGSIKDIEDVIAAKNNKMKNKVAIIKPPGIAPNAIGRVWNINPGPAADGSRL